MADQAINTVAVVGTGTVGSSWALYFATHGLETRLYDGSPEALARAETFLAENMTTLIEAGQLTLQEAQAAKARVSAFDRLEEALIDAQFVQESVYESYEVKRPVFQQLDALCAPDILLASSSSGLLMSEIQRGLTHPERCLVAHPFNPPHLIPLVELVPGAQTAPETLERAHEIYLALGKTPITLRKEVSGHIVNRLQAALWREAIDLAVQGVASIEDIDLAVSAGPGLRWALMGQHMIYHLNGGPGGMPYFLELLQEGFESYWRDLADWSELSPEAAQVMIDGVQEAMGDRTYQDMVAWRDEYLLKLVDLLQR